MVDPTADGTFESTKRSNCKKFVEGNYRLELAQPLSFVKTGICTKLSLEKFVSQCCCCYF